MEALQEKPPLYYNWHYVLWLDEKKKPFLAIPSVWRLQKMKCIIWTIDALKQCYDPWLWGTCKDNMTSSWILLSILIVSDRSFRLIRKWIFQHDEPNSNIGNSVFCVSHIRLWTLQNPLKYAAWRSVSQLPLQGSPNLSGITETVTVLLYSPGITTFSLEGGWWSFWNWHFVENNCTT